MVTADEPGVGHARNGAVGVTGQQRIDDGPQAGDVIVAPALHHPEVEERDGPIGVEPEVAGVRVAR